MTARIATFAMTLACLAATAEANTISWPFEGCEAADIAALAATGDTAWTGQPHEIGPWTLGHRASLDCAAGDCQALLTMTAEHLGTRVAAEPVAAPLLIAPRSGHLAQSLSLGGEAALGLRHNLGPAGFVQDGALKRVIMDYATVAERVSIRIRTEISCSRSKASCTVVAEPIAYIAYDERTSCGSLSVTH